MYISFRRNYLKDEERNQFVIKKNNYVSDTSYGR